jgi:hypothetical protein
MSLTSDLFSLGLKLLCVACLLHAAQRDGENGHGLVGQAGQF